MTDIIKENNIDQFNIVKIDIEGAEIYLVDDLQYLASIPDLKILLSLHPCFWDNKSQALESLESVINLFDIYDVMENKINFRVVINNSNKHEIFEVILKSK